VQIAGGLAGYQVVFHSRQMLNFQLLIKGIA